MKKTIVWLFVTFLPFFCYSIPDELLSDKGKGSYNGTLAAAMIFQEEAPYLKEWIEYHHLVGVERFYLYNNLSTDNYAEVLAPYIENGWVELIEWPYPSTNSKAWDKIQTAAYNDALAKAVREKYKWVAIIDADEFLVPGKEDSLHMLLGRFDTPTIGGIRAFWVVFGTSGVYKIPEDQLMIETLTLNGGKSDHYKSIVRPDRVAYCIDPHRCKYIGKNRKSVPLRLRDLQINHYWSRDMDYLLNVKIPRREKMETPREACLQWESGSNYETEWSYPILRFVPELRRLMGL